MFQRELEKLVASTGARLALFCDGEGEAISWCAPSMADDDAQLSGAQLAAALLYLQKKCRDAGKGESLSLSLSTDEQMFLAELLPGGYFLVVALLEFRRAPEARQALARTARLFEAEIL